ncbi:E3 ubiquitin-protein ligase ATL42-like [Rhododendron vialii]|uniref:E3 ubiquitin-protein ligase ATL42-like n=1 Tax=Rhododendron vialii TaxID=182163 RepID=UPI00265EE222|nr:E3 ubiquitin-protein ligase ATL42-like [Rhododendron vialii]
MNHLILLSSLLLSVFCHAEAQFSSDQNNPASQNTAGNFQLSFTVIILFLILTILLSIVLALYTRFCLRISAVRTNQETPDGLIIRQDPRSSGIDRTVIESLPFFKFSALRGLRGGLECAVCLSKFEDVEVLRLLPKCRHAFHIDCVDRWLQNHSSCPLCRQRISVEDLTYTNSLRFLSSQSEVREDSNVELFVQREDSRQPSSRFSIGSSFRKLEKGVEKEDELPIREESDVVDENDKFLHKFNHKIIMSDAVLKSRWSNLSSSDLLFLNSEMLGDVSSNRFSTFDSNTLENSTARATKEGGVEKMSSYPLSSGADTSNPKGTLHPNEKRSMSEIVVHPRFKEFNMRSNSFRESSVPENATREERLKRLWLPIARKTVHWYSNNRDNKFRQMTYTRESLNV